ncbi:MAG: hypothetical protein LC713_06270 [Actinobacteria bacterium]|nr:hypothetical protein [Actinomycetota bacterium]
MREPRADGALEDLAALVLGQALGAAEPVAVKQRGPAAGAADGQAAAQVQLDEPVADA